MCFETASQNDTINAKDSRGITLMLGDTVIYPSRRGSTLTMTEGELVKIINSTSVQVRREREATNYGLGFEFIDNGRLVNVGTQQLVRVL